MKNGRVMLTGATGLLGSWLLRTAPGDREVVGVVHRRRLLDGSAVRVDLRDGEAVRAVLRRVRPSVVVHAAYAKDHASIVAATRHVAEAASEVGADVVFISTDAVFSGDATPREESAAPDPVWDYGRWKATAEEAVAASPMASIIRLPLIVSIDPEDHVVEQIRSAADRGATTCWFDDELRQPAHAPELADAVWRIASLASQDRAGAWHLPGPERLSRYEIARRVVSSLGLDERVVCAERTPAEARRPRHLNLRADRAKHNIGWSPTPVLT